MNVPVSYSLLRRIAWASVRDNSLKIGSYILLDLRKTSSLPKVPLVGSKWILRGTNFQRYFFQFFALRRSTPCFAIIMTLSVEYCDIKSPENRDSFTFEAWVTLTGTGGCFSNCFRFIWLRGIGHIFSIRRKNTYGLTYILWIIIFQWRRFLSKGFPM